MYTPWGKADYITKIADGITRVATPSHGGMVLDDKHAAIMKSSPYEPFTGDYHFWEEDTDWVYVYKMFEKEIRQQNPIEWARVEKYVEPAYQDAIKQDSSFKKKESLSETQSAAKPGPSAVQKKHDSGISL